MLRTEILSYVQDDSDSKLVEKLTKSFNFAGMVPPSRPIQPNKYMFQAKLVAWLRSYIWVRSSHHFVVFVHSLDISTY